MDHTSDTFKNEPGEREMIAQALLNPDMAKELAGILTSARMFDNKDYRRIWWLIITLVEKNIRVDAFTVEQLGRETPLAEYLASIQGRPYYKRPDDLSTTLKEGTDFATLSALMNTAFPASSAPQRAAVLYDLWRHRAMVGKAKNFAYKAEQGGMNVDAGVAVLVEELEELIKATLNKPKRDIVDVVKGAFNRSREGAVATWGLAKMDEKLPIMRGAFYVVSGQSGSGKTMFSIENMMANVEKKNKTLYLTYEMDDEQLMQRGIATYLRRPYEELCEDEAGTGSEKMAAEAMEELGPYIEIDFTKPSVEKLGARLKQAQDDGVKIIFLDHLAEMVSDVDNDPVYAIDVATRTIMDFCQSSGIPVIAMAQCKASGIKPITDKDGAKVRDGQPTLGALYGGKRIQQRPHAHVAVWPQVDEREDRPEIMPVMLCCDKNRYGAPFAMMATMNGKINSWTAMTKEEVAALRGGSSAQAEPPITKEKRYKGAHSEDEDLFG